MTLPELAAIYSIISNLGLPIAISLIVWQQTRIRNLKQMQKDFGFEKIEGYVGLKTKMHQDEMKARFAAAVPEMTESIIELHTKFTKEKLDVFLEEFQGDFEELLFLAVDVYLNNGEKKREYLKHLLPRTFEFVEDTAKDVEKDSSS
jgi:hypothetical protein